MQTENNLVDSAEWPTSYFLLFMPVVYFESLWVGTCTQKQVELCFLIFFFFKPFFLFLLKKKKKKQKIVFSQLLKAGIHPNDEGVPNFQVFSIHVLKRPKKVF